jgi:hypothetical protein
MKFCSIAHLERFIRTDPAGTSSGSNPETRSSKEQNLKSKHTTAAARLLLRKNVMRVIYEKLLQISHIKFPKMYIIQCQKDWIQKDHLPDPELTFPKNPAAFRTQFRTGFGSKKHASMLDGHLVSDDGKYIIAAESGELLYWNLEERTVIFQVY